MIVMLRRSVWHHSEDSTVVFMSSPGGDDGFSVTVSDVRFASRHDTEKGTRLSQRVDISSSPK